MLCTPSGRVNASAYTVQFPPSILYTVTFTPHPASVAVKSKTVEVVYGPVAGEAVAAEIKREMAALAENVNSAVSFPPPGPAPPKGDVTPA